MGKFIKCRDGKDREIFPALIKHKDKIRHFATKFRSDMAILNILSPDLQKVASVNPDDAKEEFSQEPFDAMMEILVLAFGEKYKAEEIEEFVDLGMIPEIIDVFFGISGYRDAKKKMTAGKELDGMNYSLQ